MAEERQGVTIWKLFARHGFVHATGLEAATKGNGSPTTIRRVTAAAQRNAYGQNGGRTVATDDRGWVWVKDGDLSFDDLDFLANVCPNGTRSDLPGLMGEQFSTADLRARALNPTALCVP